MTREYYIFNNKKKSLRGKINWIHWPVPPTKSRCFIPGNGVKIDNTCDESMPYSFYTN